MDIRKSASGSPDPPRSVKSEVVDGDSKHTPTAPTPGSPAAAMDTTNGLLSNGSSKRASVSSPSGSPVTSAASDLEAKMKIEVKQESDDEKPKLRRTPPQKAAKRQPQLFNDLPDSTAEAESTFEVIDECIYSTKAIGDSMQEGEMMSCECREDWDGERNHACGEDSDCINRMTNMECPPDDCGCGPDCANQRFQRHEYANVSVIKTEKKGYGLRANTDLPPNTFLYEYVGEVIDEAKFRRRTIRYAEEGIKHFYFMSLGKNEFVDATRKGGLGRFCNHSCNPNCYVDKWVVGDKMRMGIFAKRRIQAGEELVFDYNVDRYGAEPTTCFCGEPNCLGYIGGKTQTDSAPKLSHHIIEALGLEDEGDWSTATAKKSRRPRKSGEDDEEYVESVQTRPLGEADVTKVMGSLLGCKEKWLIYKLLSRIHSSDDERVPGRVVKMHGYQIFGRILHDYRDDENLVLMILEILMRFPRITKNKIITSKIDQTVKDLATSSDNEKVRTESSALLEIWNSLELGFRIRRRANDGKDDVPREKRNVYDDRRRNSKSKSATPSPSRPPTPTRPRALATRPGFQNQPPRGPKADRERYQGGYQGGGYEKERRHNLPWGWHRARDKETGKWYYYSNEGQTRWEIPLDPCMSNARLESIPPPPLPPGQLPVDLHRMALQQILEKISDKVKRREQEAEEEAKLAEEERLKKEKAERDERRRRKEREAAKKNPKIYDEAKTKVLLEKAFAGVVPNMLRKYQDQLGGKEQLKAQARTIVGLLVRKEMKDGRRVVNPHLVCDGERRIARVKGFVKPYIQKYIAGMKKHQEAKAAKLAARDVNGQSSAAASASPMPPMPEVDTDVAMTPLLADAPDSITPETPFISTNTTDVQSYPSRDRVASPAAPSSPGKRRRSVDDEPSDSGRESPKRLRGLNMPGPDDKPPPTMAVDNGVSVC